MQAVAESQRRLHSWSVQQTFERLGEELLAAKVHFRVDAARRLRDQWNRTISESHLQPFDHVALQVAPVLAWLDEQDELQRRHAEQESALGALAAAIDAERAPPGGWRSSISPPRGWAVFRRTSKGVTRPRSVCYAA